MKYYVSNENVRFEERETSLEHHPRAEMNLVKVYTDIEEQEIKGFGGALTEASAWVYAQMSPQKQEELLDLYFGEKGNRYTMGRLHIQSCDFSLGNRAYVREGDGELKTFSIEEDFQYQIPFIKAALSRQADIQFLASPWSPPAFMKSNGEMNHGGLLREEYYDSWARLIVRYLLAYREEGIEIGRVTVQNEPAAVQTWDSCIFSGTQEAVFAVRHLRRELDSAGLNDVKIFIWDHNKDLIIERVKETFAVEGAMEAIDGIAFHWYSGDHFEALAHVRKLYPDKEIIFTEGCVEYSRFSTANQVAHAEMYAHDIIGDLKAGMNGFLDWNLILDEKGGPNHVQNFCDAPVMCDTSTGEIDVKLSYYYIGHFSRFIRPGAKRLLVSSFHKGLESTGFVNPDGSRGAVILNATDSDKTFELWADGKGCRIELEAHSIMTACL